MYLSKLYNAQFLIGILCILKKPHMAYSQHVSMCNHCFPGPKLKYFTKTLIPKKRIFVVMINRNFRSFQGDDSKNIIDLLQWESFMPAN